MFDRFEGAAGHARFESWKAPGSGKGKETEYVHEDIDLEEKNGEGPLFTERELSEEGMVEFMAQGQLAKLKECLAESYLDAQGTEGDERAKQKKELMKMIPDNRMQQLAADREEAMETAGGKLPAVFKLLVRNLKKEAYDTWGGAVKKARGGGAEGGMKKAA